MTSNTDGLYSSHVTFFTEGHGGRVATARGALKVVDPVGFYIRHPPKPHELDQDVTDDSQLFQTIHMGAAVVDEERWSLVFDGLVDRPFSISLRQLKSMPSTTVTAFHECYGSPVAPPTHALWRIGNVQWLGVRLADLIRLARPKDGATYLWSQGLESGSFAGVSADCFEKDLTMEKALKPEVLIAYGINGKALDKKRGGPVRLVVPGWFGTNSTKWVYRMTLQDCRASGPFTTKFYNEVDPTDLTGNSMRPVWMVEPNSMIVRPKPGEILQGPDVEIWGRAWGCEEIHHVAVSVDGGYTWLDDVHVEPRRSYEWQFFRSSVTLKESRTYCMVVRATDKTGVQQPMEDRRNHVHRIEVEVIASPA